MMSFERKPYFSGRVSSVEYLCANDKEKKNMIQNIHNIKSNRTNNIDSYYINMYNFNTQNNYFIQNHVGYTSENFAQYNHSHSTYY